MKAVGRICYQGADAVGEDLLAGLSKNDVMWAYASCVVISAGTGVVFKALKRMTNNPVVEKIAEPLAQAVINTVDPKAGAAYRKLRTAHMRVGTFEPGQISRINFINGDL
jgi:hypothetical protein